MQSEQFEFQPVTGKHVANVILNLPSNKAPGFSKIPARILKDSLPEHIRKTVTVASCINKLIQINRIKHLFDKETLSLIINSFVFSRLFYCSSVWSNTSAINIHKLQLVPAKFCSQDYLRASQIWSYVKQRLVVNDAVMMPKCLQGLSPSYLSDKFSTRATIHYRQTRYGNI